MFNFFRNILFFLLLTFSFKASSQYIFEWNTYYDGHAMEEVSSLTKADDGNIYMVGLAKDSIDALWMVKIDQTGNKLWSKYFSEFRMMKPKKIIQTYDTNLIITATVAENDTVEHRIWIAKINLEGKIMWEKLYRGIGDAYCSDVVQTYDSGFVIAGYTSINVDEQPDWYVLKLDSLGNFEWEKSFGTSHDDRATSVAQLLDSTIMVVGYYSYSYGGYKKASLTKLDNSGEYLWVNDLKFGMWSTANSVAPTSDSAFIIACEMRKTPLLDFNTVIIKMTTDGDTIWTQDISSPFMEHPVSVIETYDQGYAVAYTWKADGVGNTNVALVKISPSGNIIWQRIFYRKSDDYAMQIIESPDNALMIGASTYSIDKAWNFGVVKFKSLESSDLRFITPFASVLTYYNKMLPVDGIVTGYKKPQEIKIYVNRQLVGVLTNFDIVKDKNNSFSFKGDIPLESGLNEIDFIVTDYKDYKFVKTRKVYYLPAAVPHW